MKHNNQSFARFRSAVSQSWPDISSSCSECSYHDCMGYIMISPSESQELLLSGITQVRINGESGPLFLDNYPRSNAGNVVVGITKPICPYRDESGKCSVHGLKPLICDMYPLGLEMVDSRVFWAIYLDCEYVEKIRKSNKLSTLVENLCGVIDDNLTESEKIEIIDTYRKSYELASWPDGANNVMLIKEVTL
jgi:Fe-S-cluster containining protein